MDHAYTESTSAVLAHFQVSAKRGLSQSQVLESRTRHGRNALAKTREKRLVALIFEQFNDQLVIILLAAAFVSFALAFLEADGSGVESGSAFVEPIVILLILIANATVGVVQEKNADKAIEALKNYAPDETRVLRQPEEDEARDSVWTKIKAEDLVPGDLVQLGVGDKVPADLRVIEVVSSALRVDQAILTGESTSVRKDVHPISDPRAVKQDQTNMLFSGTTITFGHAIAIAVKTGNQTSIGEIQQNICEQIDEKTPLKKKLDDFGDSLAKVITVICVLVWLINVRHFNDASHGGWAKGAIYYFKIAVALAVAAIPEGLAVIITTCLALGTKKMAKKNAIVRSLPSVETLGCTSVICSDKTGTLTTNRMSVCRLVLVSDAKDASLEEYAVSGSGTWAPFGSISRLEADGNRKGKALEDGCVGMPALFELNAVCALCNESSLSYDAKTKSWRALGEPTEAALKVLSEKLGTDSTTINERLASMEPSERAAAVSKYLQSEKYEKLATLDFDRDRKSMSVICKKKNDVSNANTDSSTVMLVKGAPESILERCTNVRLSTAAGDTAPLTAATKKRLLDLVYEYGKTHAYRVLGLATVDRLPGPVSSLDLSRSEKFLELEQNMTFIGLVAMKDPPRPEVLGAIRKCRQAGIRVVVITGDNQSTAESICRQIGVFEELEDLTVGRKSLTGRQFDDLSPAEQAAAVQSASLFSRTDPIHKCKLVDLLKSAGHVVAMTGDGVNDAPALKKADIGVAMGSGTDVAKLASDMVLADDDFATIVVAVEEGRSIYNNTRQFIRYLISSNIGEVVSIFLTVLLGLPEALIPVQLLWVNLVTDGLPATALGFNPPDHEIMKHAPRAKDEPIVTRWLFVRYCLIGAYVGCATVFGYVWWYLYSPSGPQLTLEALRSFHTCAGETSAVFTGWMSRKASTMSLSILVTIEMFNAMNSLSENESLLTLPVWRNMYLVLAISLSMALHFMILYVPFFSQLFEITPLDWNEWQAVLYISLPVILLDEILKSVTRLWQDANPSSPLSASIPVSSLPLSLKTAQKPKIN